MFPFQTIVGFDDVRGLKDMMDEEDCGVRKVAYFCLGQILVLGV